jgi:hypothetical protein
LSTKAGSAAAICCVAVSTETFEARQRMSVLPLINGSCPVAQAGSCAANTCAKREPPSPRSAAFTGAMSIEISSVSRRPSNVSKASLTMRTD